MKESIANKLLYLIAALFFGICCWMFLSGCKMSEVAAAKKIAKIEQQQPKVLFTYCSFKFDPIIRIEHDTTLVSGDTVNTYITVDCDSAAETRKVTGDTGKPLKVAAKCPPCVPQYFYITTTKTVENKHKVEALTIERDQARVAAAENNQARKIWMWIAIGAFGYTVIRIGLKLTAKISLP